MRHCCRGGSFLLAEYFKLLCQSKPPCLSGRVFWIISQFALFISSYPGRNHNPRLTIIVSAGTIYHGEAYLRPLVKVHPETGKKNLFIGRHAFGIPGLSRTESRSLLKELMDFVISEPRRVYQHKWQEGELLFWDNRALLHRACAYDYRQGRVMIATRVAGDTESELAYYPEDLAAEEGRVALAKELEILRREKESLGESAVA